MVVLLVLVRGSESSPLTADKARHLYASGLSFAARTDEVRMA